MNTKFLKELGLEQEVIDKIMAENGKDIDREQRKTAVAETKLTEQTEQMSELTNKVKELETLEGSDKKILELQGKIAEFEKAETARLEAEKAEKENATLKATFDEVTKEKAFVNDFTKNAIFEQCKAELAKEENKGKGLNDIFVEVTTDKDGIFANPNPSVDIPGAGGVSAEKIDEAQVREVMGLPPLE